MTTTLDLHDGHRSKAGEALSLPFCPGSGEPLGTELDGDIVVTRCKHCCRVVAPADPSLGLRATKEQLHGAPAIVHELAAWQVAS
jgi:hypothetical protein